MRKPKLTPDQVEKLRSDYQPGGSFLMAAAKEYGVSDDTIRRAVTNPNYGQFAGVQAAVPGKKVSPFVELGTTGLNRWGGSIHEDYLTDWASLDRMVPVIRRMMDHPTVAAVTFAIEMILRNAKWTVQPASDDTADVEAQEFIESCIGDMSHTLDDHLAQALTMAWYGFAPFEIVYKRRLGPDKDLSSLYDDGMIGWRKFGFRSQDTLAPGNEWSFDENGGIQGMYQQPPTEKDTRFIPIDRMLLYRTTLHKNNPQGRSILRGAYNPWYFSKNLAEVEGIAAERMGTGLPIGYLGYDTSKEGPTSDFALLQKALRNVRADEQAALVLPYPKMGQGAPEGKGILVELLSPPSRGIIDFHQTIERYNTQIAQVMLAQFIFFGVSERGTQALAVRMTDIFQAAIHGWLEIMADTINRYAIPRLLDLNASSFAGITGLPTIEFAPASSMDVVAFTGALKQAVDANLLHPDDKIEASVREVLGLPERTEEEIEAQKQEDIAKEEAARQAREIALKTVGAQRPGQPPDQPDQPPDQKPILDEDKEKDASRGAMRAVRSVMGMFKRRAL